MSNGDSNTYQVDAVNRVKRRADRGSYDHATVREPWTPRRCVTCLTSSTANPSVHRRYSGEKEPGCTGTAVTRAGCCVTFRRVNLRA